MTDHYVLKILASARNAIHQYEAHNRPLSTNYEYVGLLGEDAFAETFGLEMELCLKRRGDRGVDFRVGKYSIDVKTARNPRFLMVEKGKCYAEIYVLYHYLEELDEVKFVGWAFGKDLVKIPPKDMGRGLINHALERELLNDFDSLCNMFDMV